MHEISIYHIEVKGLMDEDAFNATSPLEVAEVQADPAATMFIICTDQSGLIGLVRHLHRQGLVLLSVHRER
ncbi:hypothetical protein MFMK1_001566 [Metallumcola ferriviriculae]|uniref:ACT domain-containing protein n=1 Tax=Metallumcola ferriviriculae TaxID=3039180 RepID=A0AAU0UNI3_9FIRM|nr:hypothetical protein MFMK1_001566 [Desulfitibacteraceae bacterium MK1]